MQLFQQQPPGPMQTGTHRTDRATQRHGGVSVIHFLQVAQNHHFAIPPGQGLNRAPQGVELESALRELGDA